MWPKHYCLPSNNVRNTHMIYGLVRLYICYRCVCNASTFPTNVITHVLHGTNTYKVNNEL